MNINPTKTKELVISFSKAKTETTPVVIEGKHIETVEKTKLLGVTIQNNLRWDTHVEDMYKKASKRLYFLTLLKRAGLHSAELLKYYRSVVRSVMEYSSVVWHSGLTKDQSLSLEHIQKRAFKIIYPELTYSDALDVSNSQTLEDRRKQQCVTFFVKMQRENHKLNYLLPPKRTNTYNTRNFLKYPLPRVKTDRLKRSYIPYCLFNMQ